jgi:hypothetical protein
MDPECAKHHRPGQAGSLIARPEAFKTLVNPVCSHCRIEAQRRAGELRENDRVLCWIRGYSNGGAIPYRFFLNPYRVISDNYGVFVYDPDAGYARGYAPSLEFSFHGWRNGIMIMKHKDGTLYSCLSGIAVAGPRKGTRLEPVPTLVSAWGFWLERYPEAVAYQMFDRYQPIALPTRVHEDSCKSRGPADVRMAPAALVLGVVDGKHARAYPLERLVKAGLLRETVNGKDRVVLWFEPTRTAVAYLSLAAPPDVEADKRRPVTLAIDRKVAEAPFIDKETGSRWDIAGRAIAGPLKGWTLTWQDSVQVKWFAWAAEYPETTIYGK